MLRRPWRHLSRQRRLLACRTPRHPRRHCSRRCQHRPAARRAAPSGITHDGSNSLPAATTPSTATSVSAAAALLVGCNLIFDPESGITSGALVGSSCRLPPWGAAFPMSSLLPSPAEYLETVSVSCLFGSRQVHMRSSGRRQLHLWSSVGFNLGYSVRAIQRAPPHASCLTSVAAVDESSASDPKARPRLASPVVGPNPFGLCFGRAVRLYPLGLFASWHCWLWDCASAVQLCWYLPRVPFSAKDGSALAVGSAPCQRNRIRQVRTA